MTFNSTQQFSMSTPIRQTALCLSALIRVLCKHRILSQRREGRSSSLVHMSGCLWAESRAPGRWGEAMVCTGPRRGEGQLERLLLLSRSMPIRRWYHCLRANSSEPLLSGIMVVCIWRAIPAWLSYGCRFYQCGGQGLERPYKIPKKAV